MEDLDYTSYYRQLDNLIAMSEIVATEQPDCGTQELTFDIVSLQTKASRLCYMADIDYALQLAEFKHQHLDANLHYNKHLETLVEEYILPLTKDIISKVKETKTFEGHKSQHFLPVEPSFVLSLGKITGLEEGADAWESLATEYAKIDTLIKKGKPVSFPGMKSAERVWRWLQYFTQLCYLICHFKRVVMLCGQEINEEDAGHLLEAMVLKYVESEEGQNELQRFEMLSRYENDGKPLSVSQLEMLRKKLVEEVPTPLQVLYIQHINDLALLAQGLLDVACTEDELSRFVDIIAKWQLLTSRINEQSQSKLSAPTLCNEVFVDHIHGNPVDLRELKERIQRMLQYVTRKGHWFCVWSVLKHHNLLANQEREPFARQMMSKDWFGAIPESKHFKGDNLCDYNGYFSDRDYAVWQEKDYLLYKERYNKTKWKPSLCSELLRLCISMNDAFQ